MIYTPHCAVPICGSDEDLFYDFIGWFIASVGTSLLITLLFFEGPNSIVMSL